MTIINNINAQRFSFNGVEYYKNFTPVVVGNKIRILNAYDSAIELTSFPTLFSDFEVNGNTFLNVADLQSALLPILFTRATLSGGGGDGVQSVSGSMVNNTDPLNPVINSDSTKLDKVSTVDEDKAYIKLADGTQAMKPLSEIGGGGKSTFYIQIPVSQGVAASTSWWGRDTATQTIFNATFTQNAGWTPTNDFANINVQRPSNLVPFDCKIKRVLLKGHSNTAPTDVRFCVVKSKGQSGGAIVNSKIIADKTISTAGTIFEFEFTGADLDTVTTLDKGSEIRLVFFNNNVASSLFSTIMLIEFEEI
jgi:hypothetical protein